MFSWESFYKLQTLQMINFGVELGYSGWWLTVLFKIPIAENLNPTYREFPPEINIQTLTEKAQRYATGTVCCLDLKLNPCTVLPCVHQYHGSSTRRVRGTYWSTIGKQSKRTTVCFFPTITKGPGRDLKSLGGKFGVHHYQKIVPQNGWVEDIQIGEIFGQLAQTPCSLWRGFKHNPPQELKTMVFPSFASDVYMGNIPRKRPPLFFHSNSPPCCFCLDLLHRPLDENKPWCFFRNPRKDRIDCFFFRRREVIFFVTVL